MIGVGGMSVVCRARDPDLDRDVAIKLLQGHTSLGDQGRVRLQREARAMAKLAHPNVATVFEVGVHESAGLVYRVVRFDDGVGRPLWQGEDRWVVRPRVSPDGRHLALTTMEFHLEAAIAKGPCGVAQTSPPPLDDDAPSNHPS